MDDTLYTAQGTLEGDRLVEQHLPMVRRIALQLKARLPASVELDDLIQAGTIGLMDAARRYEDNRGARFDTFAGQRVRGAMLDELRAGDWGSRGLRQSGRAVEQAIQALEHRHGRAPTEGEIARELDMALADYQSVLQDIRGCQLLYLEDVAGDDAAPGAGQAEDEPLAQLLAKGLRRQLVEAIASLSEREQLLLGLYYDEGLNLREIGAVLEVSESRVCQLHSQAVSRLRAKVAGVPLRPGSARMPRAG